MVYATKRDKLFVFNIFREKDKEGVRAELDKIFQIVKNDKTCKKIICKEKRLRNKK